jgi:ADP-ribosyl-[dinitrogen reductase] hydrolase
MALEFGAPTPVDRLVREMTPGRLAAGIFTDDTETSLALAESLLNRRPLDPADLARRFLEWYRRRPEDCGLYTSMVLDGVKQGLGWETAAQRAQERSPLSAANGSVMRCWPAAVAYWNNRAQLWDDTILQSRVTHMHPECVAACLFINVMIFEMLHGTDRQAAFDTALKEVDLDPEMRQMIVAAPGRRREQLRNTGWVRHTMESVLWGFLTTDSFAEAVVQVANLGADADSSATVVGALAGSWYGLTGIPASWQEKLHGAWPIRSETIWRSAQFVDLADQLSGA